jgi:hypothetical protein
MKKTYIVFLLISLVSTAWAQSVPVVSVKGKPNGPSEYISDNIPSFSFSEPFKLIVDVSGVPNLAGVEPIYLWGFIEGCCGSPVNTDFCNSPSSQVMTKESANVWSIVVPSVKSYLNISYKQAKDASAAAGDNGRPAGQPAFGFLVKAQNGCSGGQTANINVPFTGPVYIKQEFESFPLNCSQADVLTLSYNQDLETDPAMQALTSVYLYATASLSDGSTVEPYAPAVVGSTASLQLKKNGSQYTISIIPTSFFTVPVGKSITAINVVIQSQADPNVNFGSAKVVKMVTIK